MIYWVLDENHNPIHGTRDTWAAIWEDKDARIVKQEKLGEIFISTVFLGIDHNFSSDPMHVPILFETMVFGLDEEYQDRYATWDQAIKGHNKAKRWARTKLVEKV